MEIVNNFATGLLENTQKHKHTRENKYIWNWISYLCESGQTTMDRDRQLFREVKQGINSSLVRFYKWKSRTVSYGRTRGIDPDSIHQAHREGYETIQRPTGGGKVFHQEDLCFSVIWRKSQKEIPWNIHDSYCSLHRWVQSVLEEIGYTSTMTKEKSSKNRGWCFQEPVAHDLIQGNNKIVGGAQWRDQDTAIHQGSIQLPLSPETVTLFKSSFESFFKVTLIE